jgi:hypothetical protein
MSGRLSLSIFFALISVACATPDVASPASPGDLTILLHRDASGAHPILVVTITNRSDKPVCLPAEVLQNPDSYEMDLRLRDRGRRPVRSHEPGFLIPPIRGSVRLEPGQTARGQYFLDSRFRLRAAGNPFPSGMSAQAAFPYDYCDDTSSLRAASAWQSI